MRHFCTYFDSRYLARGLTLLRSLESHAGEFTLWVLCQDDVTFEVLSRLGSKNVRLVTIADLLAADPELAATRETRSLVEFYFTCTPCFPEYLLERHPEIDTLTYVDADLYFYADPSILLEELGGGSVLIIGHRFPERLRHLERFGIYNVGLLVFRNDAAGRECLGWWRNRCLEWCHLREEGGKFGDQKYLDDWPSRFDGVVVSRQKGANLAPWNWMRYEVTRGQGRLLVDGEPLIFFHFHGLEVLNGWVTRPVPYYGAEARSAGQRRIYVAYLRALGRSIAWLRRRAGTGAVASGAVPGEWRRGVPKGLLMGDLALTIGPICWFARGRLRPVVRRLRRRLPEAEPREIAAEEKATVAS